MSLEVPLTQPYVVPLKGIRVEILGSKIIVGAAVDLIGSALGCHQNRRRGPVAVLGRIVRLDRELLQGVRRRRRKAP